MMITIIIYNNNIHVYAITEFITVDVDYILGLGGSSANVTFPPCVAGPPPVQQCLNVTAYDDDISEITEIFQLQVVSAYPSNADITMNSMTDIQLTDNDSKIIIVSECRSYSYQWYSGLNDLCYLCL